MSDSGSLQVKLTREYSDTIFPSTETHTLTPEYAPLELICYALRLRYIALGVSHETAIRPDFSVFEIKISEPLALDNFSNMENRIETAWEILDFIYKEYMSARKLTDTNKKIYREILSVLMCLSVNPILVPKNVKFTGSFIAAPLGTISLN